MECDVCFYTFYEEDDFFPLHCCKNNRVCQSCLQLLLIPQCPFCRSNLPHLQDKKCSISYTNTQTFFSRDLEYYINPYDEYYTDSRALRRQMKRIRKLKEREEHDRRNRYLQLMHHEESKSELVRQIKEDIHHYHQEDDIFSMEEEDEISSEGNTMVSLHQKDNPF